MLMVVHFAWDEVVNLVVILLYHIYITLKHSANYDFEFYSDLPIKDNFIDKYHYLESVNIIFEVDVV